MNPKVHVGPARSVKEQKRETWQWIKENQPELAQLMTDLAKIDPKAIRSVTIGEPTTTGYIEMTPERMAAWWGLYEPRKRR